VAKGTDIGDADLLRRYAAARVAQTRRVLGFTDGLLRLFANELPGLTIARNLALNTLEVLPPVKHLLLARTAGLTGRLPRLSRGLPLASAP
jgi:2-polyprenyl-6-methoxyphenol hydroxylase-like FAD-dependent oxidoreductase